MCNRYYVKYMHVFDVFICLKNMEIMFIASISNSTILQEIKPVEKFFFFIKEHQFMSITRY